MPELPEVETVRQSLAGRVAGRMIEGFEVYFPGSIEGDTPESLRERIVGRRIARCERRGKYLLFPLADDGVLIVHLRMTGRLTAERGEAAPNAHTRWVLRLDDGWSLRFDDVRKFGRIEWVQDEKALAERVRVGPDPLDADFDEEAFAAILSGRKRPVKSLLLDQQLIGGIGNIYADEALFRAGIAPVRPAGSLIDQEVRALHRAIRQVLQEGLRFRGTTLRDYVDGDGREGAYQERLQVYGKEGRACPRCGRPVERIKLSGRSSYHCPRCQR